MQVRKTLPSQLCSDVVCHSDETLTNTRSLIVNIFSWLAFLLTLIPISAGANTQTQQLHTIDRQITVLKDQISQHQKQSTQLTQALSSTEKQIGQSIRHLNDLQKSKAQHAVQLQMLLAQSKTLEQQLSTQQKQLARQLQLRYQMHAQEPIVLLLTQENPEKTHHLFVLYEYLLQTHYQTISKLKNTQTTLITHQQTLKKNIKATASLEKNIQSEQQTLNNNKQYHQALLNTLHQKIKTQENSLEEFKQNRERLSHLFTTLTQHAPGTTRAALNLSHHHLNYPISVSKNQIQKKPHGVLFKAPQGTTVRAVARGRVVFSDWLKGYGLLIIIDHGNGLMSLYAHNQTLLKDKNQQVLNGDPVSSVGHTGGIRENGLYFELRQHGKVVSPAKWLS